MKASIIIALYNQEKYIEECLKSLDKQSFTDFEIIIVDDGSTDNSKLKAKSVKSKFKIKNLKLIEQKHQGPAKARNLGVKYAKGDILVFLDGDMYFAKDFLKDLISPIKLGKTKGTFSTEEYVANWDNVWARCWNYNWNLADKKRIDPQRADQARDFRAILKKEFEKVKGFDNIGYTDTWTLSEKLDYRPIATKALYYHYNPSSLKEVFIQAKWVAKRKYKFGWLGKLIALLRVNPIFSLVNGLIKSVYKKEPGFLIFKLIYDFGYTIGLLEFVGPK